MSTARPEDTDTLDERHGAKTSPTDTTWPRVAPLHHGGGSAEETEWLPMERRPWGTEGESRSQPGGAGGESYSLDEEAPEALVGAYRILRPIGRGGMATVYLARRHDGEYRRHVAIKMISATRRGDKELIDRFRTERQILADLDHPNVVRLLDGATAPDGRPYMVMEHVDGLPIHDYCRRHSLSLTERLELFHTVCLAVDHAHRHHIVHRDVKPQNILVTREGVVKLLDFGIAKLLRPEARPDTAGATWAERPQRLGAELLQPMTPGYASPEQICGDEITPASDVYALGLLAYKLLTDRLPYGDTRQRGWRMQRMERFLRKEPPTKPSLAAGSLVGSGARRRAIARDLDAIVIKALSIEPEGRYATAGELAEDVARCLRRRPVLARPPSPGARALSAVVRASRAVASGILRAIRHSRADSDAST